jgi:dienelactone hydrolase
MKRNMLLTVIGLLFSSCLWAQTKAEKKAINIDNLHGWSGFDTRNYNITNDGKFISYSTEADCITIVSANQRFKKTISGISISSCFFSNDSERIGYKTNIGNSFVILNFTDDRADTIEKVDLYSLIEHNSTEYILYLTGGSLTLRNLKTGQILVVDEGVDRFWINGPRTAITYTSKAGLFWWDIKKKLGNKITDVTEVQNTSFDESGSKFLFNYSADVKRDQHVIGYYSASSDSTVLIDDNFAGIDTSFCITNGPLKFNSDGNYIVFPLAKKRDLDKYTSQLKDKINLWSYNHQERYLDDRDKLPLVSYAIKNIQDNTSSVIQVEEGRDEIIAGPGRSFLLVKRHFISIPEQFLNVGRKPQFKVILLSDGSEKKIVPDDHVLIGDVSLSPDEKYIWWYNAVNDDIYTYELSCDKLRNVTREIKIPRDMKLQREGSYSYRFINRVGLLRKEQWLLNDRAFIVRDQFDIWQVDPTSNIAPINLTHGYGRKNQISFDFLPFNIGEKFQEGQVIVVRVQNQENMDNGFAKITVGDGNSLKLGLLDNCLYSWSLGYPPLTPTVMKAKNKDVWLMCRQTASESPNLVLTYDFKNYTGITDVHPEREYNWLTSEFIKYPMKGGKEGKGILYKPENFDPLKKYPVIFHYYQKKSHELHLFIKPDLSNGALNIPWYVSNEYLVFCPDIINEEPGEITETTLNSVNSAIDYFSRYSWMDTTRMGIQGHSFGAYETNILAAYSRRFAAAQSSAGISDAIRGATDFSHDLPGFWMYESGQFNFNCNIWESLHTYVKNSPIFKVDQITTPIFLMHNRKDGAVPFGQSEALFYALRRLIKPVWFVQYVDAGHTLLKPDDRLDFTIRQQQFFDHYLKGKPKPKWLVDGSLSLELDTQGSTLLNK